MTAQEAWITGLGIVSPIGVGKDTFLEGLRAGRRNLGRLSGLDADKFRIGSGGEVDLADVAGETDGARRGFAFALHACRQALWGEVRDRQLPGM